MYIIKGFMVMKPLADNTPGIVSPLGELSTYAKTFSKDIGHYASAESPDVDLMAFTSQVDDEAPKTVPATYRPVLLAVGQWVYENAVAGIFSDSESDFSSALLGEFADRLTDLDVGQMTQGDTANVWAPQYVQFTVTDPAVEGEVNRVRLWFSDDAFRSQYDDFHIDVVPPIDTVDDFFKTAVEVKALLDQYDDSERMARIQEQIGDLPPTLTRVEMYEWSNPIEPDYELSTPWAVIIYGPAGNNIDNIKAALAKYVLDNSAHDRTEWEDYIPDLFKATEFIITPMWANFSIPNETLVRGLYSPTIRHSEVLALAKATATRYDPLHVEDVVETTVANWRSMALIAVGSPDNRDGILRLSQRHPDYIVISTQDNEFSRMSPSTQEWSVMLSEMLKVADGMTEYSDLPFGMTRLMRDGVMYLVSSFEEFQYLVVSRVSYEDLFGPVDPAGNPDDGEVIA
jgi:hypothetical protein